MTKLHSTQPLTVRASESTHSAYADAAEDVAASLAGSAGPPDLLLAFVGGQHARKTEDVTRVLRERLGPRTTVGVSVSSTIYNRSEHEDMPAVVAMGLTVPNGSVNAFTYQDLPHAEHDESHTIDELIDATGISDRTRGVLLFGDPFSMPASSFVRALDAAIDRVHSDDTSRPRVPVIGGMASWAISTGHNTLVHNGRVMHTGGIGVVIEGDITIDTVVSQGCRPIGKPMVITAASRNIIKGLSGVLAVDAIREMVDGLDDADRELLSKGLQVGIVTNEYKPHFGRGDFLIRPVIGIDQTTGSVAIGEQVRVGQTIQLHVRDASTATEDLKLVLQTQELYGPVAGGLLVSCAGRGRSLFDTPSHDASIVSRTLRAVNQIDTDEPEHCSPALAGFHAHTEFGPTAGRTGVHLHTATLALFRA